PEAEPRRCDDFVPAVPDCRQAQQRLVHAVTDWTSARASCRSRSARKLPESPEKLGSRLTLAPSVTTASAGGLKLKFVAAGRLNAMEGNLLSIAVVPLRVCPDTFSGRPVAASTLMVTSVTSEVSVCGIKPSW